MDFCNFCAKNSENVKQINESEVTSGCNLIKINKLLHIFQNELVKFILNNKDSRICKRCLKQLKNCYEFVQQIQNSEKLNRFKEIKTEHDYVGAQRNDGGNETDKEKVTVKDCELNAYKDLNVIRSGLHLKPILPKTEFTETVNQNVKKCRDKARLYKCLKCAETFKSHKHLNEHEKDFCKNKYFKYFKVCKFCHKCYNKADSLNTHVSTKHAQGEFLCCLCQDKLFTAKGYLSRHIQKVHQHESLKFFCGECEDFQCLSSHEELRDHFLSNHSLDVENQTQASLNDEYMDLEMHEEFLDEFLLAHTNENSFQFSECWEALDLHLPDILAASEANLNNLQEFTEAFSCPKCYEQFKRPQYLLKHLADIHDLPVLMCRVCSKCFASYQDFKRHKLQKCLKNSKLCTDALQCPYCSKKFNNSLSLKQHIRIVHCQLKKHICQLCDKQFSTLDHLKKHVLSQHQNERKHLCMVCDKSFTQLGHLKQHLAIHTTGKTIQCSECSLKFWRKIDLKKHHQKNHLSG